MKNEKYNKKWLGSISVCEICSKPFGKYFIDGKTHFGAWALMCESCHSKVGCGLGIKKGQKYITKTKMGVAWL